MHDMLQRVLSHNGVILVSLIDSMSVWKKTVSKISRVNLKGHFMFGKVFVCCFRQFVFHFPLRAFSFSYFNPLAPYIKNQILLSCRHTLLIKLLGRSYYNTKKIHLG